MTYCHNCETQVETTTADYYGVPITVCADCGIELSAVEQ